MNSIVLTHVVRFIIFVLLQVLVCRQIAIGWEGFNYIHIIIYPIFIMLLPIRIPRPTLIGLGFLIGIAVDMFYLTPGVHASASVFTAFIRPVILKAMAPRGGYNLNDSPTMEKFGFTWFGIYSSSLLMLHLVFYFSMELFTPAEIVEITLRSISSFFPSILIILLYISALKPRE